MMHDRYYRTYPQSCETPPYQNVTASNQQQTYSVSGVPGPRATDPGVIVGREVSSEISRLPLDLRFAKLYQIFTRSDFRDLQEIYPAAVEAVFGFQSTASTYRQQYAAISGQWQADQPYIPVSFCDISQNYKLVYDAGFQLLNADGPIFRFLVSVSGGRVSTSPRYYFPVSCLSTSVRRSLENGIIPAWYRDKVPQSGELFSGDELDSSARISLSAFEFYFAHFAYHLVNPDLRTNNPAEPDCLFMALVDNYSTVFFNAAAILDNQRFSSTHYGGGPPRRSLGFFQNSRTGPEAPVSEPLGPLPQTNPLASSENLECLINTFVEFWLNTSGFTSQKYSRKYPSSTRFSDRGRHSPSFGQSPLSPGGSRRRLTMSQNVPTVFPPTSAVQAFRQIVKVLHEFAFAPVLERGYHKNMETNLLDIKRHIIPQLVQRPLYDLLKLTMKKYPMDASFRYIYELWLTYIQPWRYENLLNHSPNSDDMVIVSKDNKWISFVTENLLFYTTLFQNFVDRMLRVDFSVPFNTFAVYRVGKVLYDSEMYHLVRSVEDQLFGTKKAPPRSGMSPTKSTVKNHLADLEGPSYTYTSFFDPENCGKVRELLKILVAAERRISRKLIDSRALPRRGTADVQYWKDLVLNGFKQLFGLVAGPVFGMKLQPMELERMSKQISKGIECFSAVFGIQYEELCEEEGEPVTLAISSPETEFLLDRPLVSKPSESATSSGRHRRTSTKRRQSVVESLESSWISCLTEPEKQPPKSWEIALLIPLLGTLSHHLNSIYGPQIEEIYNRQDFKARLLHPLIQPPHMPAQTSGALAGTALPARINLRPLASMYVIGTIVFLWFFLWMADIGYIRGFLFTVFIIAAYLVSNALVEPFRDRTGRP